MSSLNLKELKIEVTDNCKSNWLVGSVHGTSILLQEAEPSTEWVDGDRAIFCSLQIKTFGIIGEMSAELNIEQVESLIDGLEKMRKSMVLSKADNDRAKRLINAKSEDIK